MTSRTELEGTPQENGQERLYSPRDLVLVMDTSFLIQLSTRSIWAYNVWFGAQQQARDEGKKFQFFMSNGVIDEFERIRREERRDKEHGLPFVHQTLEQLLGSFEGIPLSPGDSDYEAARRAWLRHVILRFSPQSHKVRRGINMVDLSVSAGAREIARQGAMVWLASYDFRDVIGPLRKDAQRITEEGLDITAVAPSPIEARCFENTIHADRNGRLHPVLNRQVVADLQVAKLHRGAYTYVVFERGIQSGDATFDVAVGVVEFRDVRKVQIPSEYRSAVKNLFLIPAIRLDSVVQRGVGDLMRGYFRRSNPNLPYRLLVVENQRPFFPLLISPSGKQDSWFRWYVSMQTTSDFLYHQTDSPWAKTHFRPRHKPRNLT